MKKKKKNHPSLQTQQQSVLTKHHLSEDQIRLQKDVLCNKKTLRHLLKHYVRRFKTIKHNLVQTQKAQTDWSSSGSTAVCEKTRVSQQPEKTKES